MSTGEEVRSLAEDIKDGFEDKNGNPAGCVLIDPDQELKEYAYNAKAKARPMNRGEYNELYGNLRGNPGDEGFLEIREGLDYRWTQKELFLETHVNDTGKISDGYHTFDELYDFRKMYNACLFNEWAAQNRYEVHKSKLHFDGEECFGGGWFIVVAVLPGGQVSNHYKMEDWDLFSCVETEKALYEFDGHGTSDVLDRLREVAMI